MRYKAQMINFSKMMKPPEQPEEAKSKFAVSRCLLIVPNFWKLYLRILKVKPSVIEG